jgi:hypothetical protein
VPFLRVIRDKRGYETTYLMDWHREGDRQRSHILYVFRTPGGARVGREALDQEMRRTVEALYPSITFDWPAVLKTQQVIESSPDLRRARKRRRPDDDSDAAEAAAPSTAPPSRPPQAPPPPVPATIEGTTPDERVAFLERWYPLVRGRILQRAYDPARREALLALAERLNPALWSDADQITTGLQHAADALDRLGRVLSKRRRRVRRPKTAETGAPAAPPSADTDPTTSET